MSSPNYRLHASVLMCTRWSVCCPMIRVIQFTHLIDSAARHYSLPRVFPNLPYCNSPWPANVLAAYNKLSEIYRHALRISRQEDIDPLQLIPPFSHRWSHVTSPTSYTRWPNRHGFMTVAVRHNQALQAYVYNALQLSPDRAKQVGCLNMHCHHILITPQW